MAITDSLSPIGSEETVVEHVGNALQLLSIAIGAEPQDAQALIRAAIARLTTARRMLVRDASPSSLNTAHYPEDMCWAPVPEMGQSRCTRPAGHDGEHRCKAADVDARRP